MKYVLSLICIGSVTALFATTSYAQLPSSAAIVGAMRCPSYPDTQFLDPEKFDVTTLTPAGCHRGAVPDGASHSDTTPAMGSAVEAH